jgi:secretion/DNA translocation related CpaE-like protein
VTSTDGAPAVLLLSADAVLAEQVGLVAAGIGLRCAVSADPDDAVAPVAGLVVVGSDLLLRCPPGPGDLVVAHDGEALRSSAGVAHRLPSGRDGLARELADGTTGRGGGAVVAVLGAAGGAGTSTLALALAVHGRGWLVDLDPVRSCTEAATGSERVAGARWPDLLHLAGRLPPGVLLERLPTADGVPLVTWSAHDDAPPGAGPSPAAVEAVVAAGRAAAPLVVLDLAAAGTPAPGPSWRLTDAAVLVVPDEVPAVVAARRLVTALRAVVGTVHVVVVGRRPGGPGARAVAEVLGVPTAVRWRRQPALAAAADDGDLVAAVRRGATAAVARDLLDPLGVRR